LMNDYVYLEEVGRQIGEWGREIARGGYVNEQQLRGGGRGRGRGQYRARGMASSQGGRGKTKREILRTQLAIRDVDMMLLPAGMEKRKLNQSHWDFKNKTAFLTIQFIFHPPPHPLRPSHIPPDPPIVLMTHRNNIDTPLLSLIQKQISEKSKKNGNFPGWLRSMTFPDDPDAAEPFELPSCNMRAPSNPTRQAPAYHKLDCSQKLVTLLRHKKIVEYPVIEVWEEGSFTGLLVDDRGLIAQNEDEDEERRPKRRKLDVRKGKAAITGLLGEYGSDGDEPEEAEATPNALSKLDGYADSDFERDNDKDGYGIHVEDATEWGEDDDDESPDENPASLLEKLKQAGVLVDEVDDEEKVDWGDSD